jgi:hypothetical protein
MYHLLLLLSMCLKSVMAEVCMYSAMPCGRTQDGTRRETMQCKRWRVVLSIKNKKDRRKKALPSPLHECMHSIYMRFALALRCKKLAS